MENKNKFIVEKIRSEYIEKEPNAVQELKALDAKVKRPSAVFGYTFGTVGALVLGTGMSLAMGVIGSMPVLGVAIGVVGIAMVSVNYPIYKKLLANSRKKHADEIIAASDKIINEQ